MHRNEHTIEIARPPPTVFPYLTEPEQLKRWVGGLVEFAPLGDGEARVGAQSRQVMRVMGKDLRVEGELTRLEPGRLVEARLNGEGFTTTTVHRLEEIGSSTRLTVTLESAYSMLVARFFARVVTHEAQRKLEADLTRLKALVEAETTPT